MSSLASVLMGVRIALRVSHVYPISHTSGVLRPCKGYPGGQGQCSISKNRVEPAMALSCRRTIAKGTAVPASRQASAVSTYFIVSALPCGTELHWYKEGSTAEAAARAST